MIEIYTDGCCLGNPGVGGWAVWLRMGEYEKTLSGQKLHTTNNQMELQATIEALKMLKTNQYPIKIHTDSTYVKQGITLWIHRWKKNNWKTSKKEPVKNRELWKELDALQQRFKIDWCWVKGHSGNDGNELVDRLAKSAAMQQGMNDEKNICLQD